MVGNRRGKRLTVNLHLEEGDSRSTFKLMRMHSSETRKDAFTIGVTTPPSSAPRNCYTIFVKPVGQYAGLIFVEAFVKRISSSSSAHSNKKTILTYGDTTILASAQLERL